MAMLPPPAPPPPVVVPPPPAPAPSASGSAGPPPAPAAPAPAGPSNVSTGARILETPTTPDLRCWVKFVRGTPYQGEYGFDWVEWQRDPDPRHLTDELTQVASIPIANFEYCYDSATQQYVAVATDAHLKRKLQNEYPRVLIYGEDYYSAWLSMRPNQEIKLELHVELLNGEPLNGDYLTFKPHASYQVTVNGQVNEAIRLVPTGPAAGSPAPATPAPAPPSPAGGSPAPAPASPGPGAGATAPGGGAAAAQVVVATIKCLSACRDTKLEVLDEKGTVVGQLNVVDNTKLYRLPIRVVYLVKDGPASATNLAALKAGYGSLNLADFLNKNSLNQAQIEAVFENTLTSYELLFDEASWAGKFYDIAGNYFTDDAGPPKVFFVDKVISDYKAKYEGRGATPFRGLVVVMTDIRKNPADAEGGVSKVIPLDFKGIVIYSTNLNDKQSYAHEIGHALGLHHTFLGTAEQADLTARKAGIVSNRNAAAANTRNRAIYATRRRQFQAQLAASPPGSPARAAAQASLNADRIANAENERLIAEQRARVATAELEVQNSALNTFRFVRGQTENIMDYLVAGVAIPKINFYHWQWKIMQTDVVQYYGSVSP